MQRERSILFTTVLQLLNAASSVNYQTLQQEAHRLSNRIDAYQMCEPSTSYLEIYQLDHSAALLLPADAPTYFIALHATPNGNCLYNAVSLLLVGDASLATELRVRTAVALMQLQNIVLHSQRPMITQLIQEQLVLYDPFASTEYGLNSHTITPNQMCMVLHNEVVSTLNNQSCSGMWQLQALATALGMTLQSMYPNNIANIRSLFNRLVTPLLPYSNSVQSLPVIWSGYVNEKGQFKPNHFVPLAHCSRLNNLTENVNHTLPNVAAASSNNTQPCKTPYVSNRLLNVTAASNNNTMSCKTPDISHRLLHVTTVSSKTTKPSKTCTVKIFNNNKTN